MIVALGARMRHFIYEEDVGQMGKNADIEPAAAAAAISPRM